MIEEVDLHITNKCNLRCKYCITNAGKSFYHEMTKDEIFKLINQFKELQLKEVHITGGEPLLREDIFEILEYIKTKTNINPVLQTNGVLLNTKVVKRLKTTGLKTVVISLDGLAKYHNSYRSQKYSFERTIEGIKRLVKNNFDVRINAVASSENLEDLPKLIDFCDKLGIKKFSINYLTPLISNRIDNNKFIDADVWYSFTKRIENLDVKLDLSYEVAYIKKENNLLIKNTDCTCKLLKKNWLLIRCDGELFLCYLFFHQKSYSLGNVNLKSLERILINEWQNGHELEKSKCIDCDVFDECKGGCYGLNYLGKFNEINCNFKNTGLIPVCVFIKKNLISKRISNVSPYTL